MRNLKIAIEIFFLFALFSCGKNYKQKAEEKLNLAISICNEGDSLTALIQLD